MPHQREAAPWGPTRHCEARFPAPQDPRSFEPADRRPRHSSSSAHPLFDALLADASLLGQRVRWITIATPR